MPESSRGDGASRSPSGRAGRPRSGRGAGTGRAGGREPGGARSGGARAGGGRAGLPGSGGSEDRLGGAPGPRGTGYGGGRGRPGGGVGGSGTGYGGGRGRPGGGVGGSGTGYGGGRGRPGGGAGGSGTGYGGSGAGSSYRGAGRSGSGAGRPASSAAGRDADSGGSRYRGAGPVADRGAAPSRRPQAFRSSSHKEGGRGYSSGGWDRPAPRRDSPAASRRDGPGSRRETEPEDVSESGPLPSSIGRAATTGRNLWPSAPRAPRSEPPGGQRGELAGASRRIPGSSSASRPATSRRSPTTGGYQRPSPARRSPGGPSKPFGRGGRLSEPSGGRGSAKVRRELGGDQVEGRQAVRELLAAHRREVHEVWMMEGSDPAAILREIQSLARTNHVPVRLVSQRQIQQVQGSEAPQGVIAFAEPLTEADLSDLVGLRFNESERWARALPDDEAFGPEAAHGDAEPGDTGRGAEPEDAGPRTRRRRRARGNWRRRARGRRAGGATPRPGTPVRRASHAKAARGAGAERMAFLVVVDGVTDPQNLGALLRSAECAGVTGVVLPRHRSAHVTPTVTKVAAGAVEHVSVAVVPGVPGALQELERLGVWTVGLDERGSEPVFNLPLGDRPIALVIGAEGRGLAPLSRQRCDVLARIPLHGSIDSLNVSAAGAVAMFEVARQRSAQAGKRS